MNISMKSLANLPFISYFNRFDHARCDKVLRSKKRSNK